LYFFLALTGIFLFHYGLRGYLGPFGLVLHGYLFPSSGDIYHSL
jgi:hypothetical protein